MPKSLPLKIVLFTVLLLAATIGLWSIVYSGDADPKNIKYILWKAGLYKLDSERAGAAMVGDAHKEELVIGKTKDQLEQRFGKLATLSEVSDYYRRGHDDYWKDSDVLFIRNTPWMIVFNRGKATNLVLLKGY